MNTDNSPFEAGYESAKQSVITFLGEVSREYDLPATLINILIYEIALEARNFTFSALLGNCEVHYPENSQATPKPIQNNSQSNLEPITIDTSSKKAKDKMIKTEDALKEFEQMGIKVTKTDKPSNLEGKSA